VSALVQRGLRRSMKMHRWRKWTGLAALAAGVCLQTVIACDPGAWYAPGYYGAGYYDSGYYYEETWAYPGTCCGGDGFDFWFDWWD